MVNVQLLLSTTCCCDKKKSVCVCCSWNNGGVLDAKATAATCRCTILHMAGTHFFYADVIRATSYRHGLIFGIALSVVAD